jgi:Mrp family chromosome partitioning ATPase
MGLFSDAQFKAQQVPSGDACLDEANDQFEPAPPFQADVKIAGELGNSLDLVWSRVRTWRQFVPGTQGQAIALAHWEPREGATTLAMALAFRAAQIDATCSFCLADFDLFHSGLSFATGLEAEAGVSNILLDQSTIDASLCPTALPNLFILPAGYPAVGRQVSRLYDQCRELCESLAARFHYVLLDMPSLRVHPNFAAWASGLAPALLVIRAGQARRPAVAKAIGTLGMMRLDIAGLILNAREYHVPRWLYTRT